MTATVRMRSTRITRRVQAPRSRAGKTGAHTDTYHGRFVKLVPDTQVIETMEFKTTDPAMIGEMTVTFTLTDVDGATDVLAIHDNVSSGIALADNETGWSMALDKLVLLVEGKQF